MYRTQAYAQPSKTYQKIDQKNVGKNDQIFASKNQMKKWCKKMIKKVVYFLQDKILKYAEYIDTK